MSHRDDSKGYATAPVSAWNYDMKSGPRGQKVLLLTIGGCAVQGMFADPEGKYFVAWAPLPQRNKALEKELGIKI